MDELLMLLIPLVILCIVSGPIALVLSIVALSKISQRSYTPPGQPAIPPPISTGPVEHSVTPLVERVTTVREQLAPLAPTIAQLAPTVETPTAPGEFVRPSVDIPSEAPTWSPTEFFVKEPEAASQPQAQAGISRPSLEQVIGTRWVMIAGVVSVFFAVGFFLKYAYDNALIGPWGRIAIAAAAGFGALIIGEVTRRRGYQIVAKGVTALGFAILYAAVFSAYRVYHLIPATPSFALAIVVTAGAMAYATALNEVLIAVLALLGGYLTPILLSTGQNLPVQLFLYVLILGLGAMACAAYRKWPGVNLLCFFGTYGLYTGWFESFYRSTMKPVEGLPPQMHIALIWLGVFFLVFLALPLLYGLVHNSPARKQDMTLILSNAAATLYYLWAILYPVHRNEMALCCAGLFAIHLVAALGVFRRCPQDDDCRMALVAIGLFFVTLAIPLYFHLYIVALSWAAEAAVLCFIGLRYRSPLTQVAAGIAMALSLFKLAEQLPLHNESFSLVFNPQFGSWCFVAAMASVAHILYRRDNSLSSEIRSTVFQFLYFMSVMILTVVCVLEWYGECRFNHAADRINLPAFLRGIYVLASVVPLLFLIRPVSPAGRGMPQTALALGVLATAYALIAFPLVHHSAYRLFFNGWFAYGAVFCASLFVLAFLLRRAMEPADWGLSGKTITLFVRLVPAILISMELFLFWHFRGPLEAKASDWYFYPTCLVFILWTLYGMILIPRLGATAGVVGAMILVFLYPDAHFSAFTLLVNRWFLMGILLIASISAAAVLARWLIPADSIDRPIGAILALTATITLWLLVTEEIYLYWYCRHLYGDRLVNWYYFSNMYISIFWAVYGATLMVAGFAKHLRLVRYLALGLFALLLAKVFLIDMSNVPSVYRMAAFLATGLTLLGVSYLYMYAKKKGLLDAVTHLER